MAKFVFSHSKLRKQPFFANIFKIQGGQDPLPPFRRPWLRLLWHSCSWPYIKTNMVVVASQRLLTVLRLTVDLCFGFDLLHSRKCSLLTHSSHLCASDSGVRRKFSSMIFIQWHMVVIFIWCVPFVTSQFDVIFILPNQRFGEVCWHSMHIRLHQWFLTFFLPRPP